MAIGDAVFLDTSILLDGLIELRPGSAPQRIWTAIAKGRLPPAMTAWHCCLEFYSVSTRLPEEFRLSPVNALRLLEEEILARVEIHHLPPRSRLRLLRSAAGDGLAGGRIYDAHIGEIARAAGASVIVTGNRRHFVSLLRHGMQVLGPEEFVAEAGLGS